MTQAVLVATRVEMNEGWPALFHVRVVPSLHIFVEVGRQFQIVFQWQV